MFPNKHRLSQGDCLKTFKSLIIIMFEGWKLRSLHHKYMHICVYNVIIMAPTNKYKQCCY